MACMRLRVRIPPSPLGFAEIRARYRWAHSRVVRRSLDVRKIKGSIPFGPTSNQSRRHTSMQQAPRSLKKPFHLKFVPGENRFTLSLHSNPESPPLSSISILEPPKIVDNQIMPSVMYLETQGEWREGHGSVLFNSLKRVFERLAHDYGLPVVHEDFTFDRIGERFLQKHGYSTQKEEIYRSAQRRIKPVNHELKPEEESALNWFKMHLGSPESSKK